MSKQNKVLIYVLILGLFAILNGAYLKTNGNLNANIMLGAGLIMELLAITGFFLLNPVLNGKPK